MTDARLPERWLNDRRLLRLPDDAFRLFVVALMWSVANRTDGVITDDDMPLIPRADTGLAGQLVTAGLWARGDGCWIIPDFEDTQTTRHQLQILDNVRRRDREKKRRKRAAALGVSADVSADSTAVPGDIPGGQSPGTDRGTILGQDRPGPYGPDRPVLQGQNHEAGPIHVGSEADDAGGSGDGESPDTVTVPHIFSSVANSQRPRVHNGSGNTSSGAQHLADPVHLQSQATDRNARARCPRCGRDSRVMSNGFLHPHGPADRLTGIRACHRVRLVS